MKDRPDLNILSKEIYEANKLKGWHDKEYSNEHYLCLVISELMEAVEADRKGRRADLDSFNRAMEIGVNATDDVNYYNAISFERNIKDSIQDELADAVIRLLDLAGNTSTNIDDNIIEESINNYDFNIVPNRTFTENIYNVCSCMLSVSPNVPIAIHTALISISITCMVLSIDLWLYVELKLKYNSTRPYKHGKEY